MGRSAPSHFLILNRHQCLRFRMPLALTARLGRDEIMRALGTTGARAARVSSEREREWALFDGGFAD
jgi:hypothetical protein